MAAELTATIKASVSWQYTKAETGMTSPTQDVNTLSYTRNIINGTGSVGTADLLYVVQSSIAADGDVTYDLDGTLTDFFATQIDMARLKFMYINLTNDTSAASISIGNAANPLDTWISDPTATIKLYNNGIFLLGSGSATSYLVTADTADEIMILNDDDTNIATVNVCLIGSSA